MKILIAHDGSESSQLALADLAHAGLPATVECHVLTAADVFVPPNLELQQLTTQPGLPPAVLSARRNALAALGEAKAIAERGVAAVRGMFPSWRVTSEAVADSPAWAVLKKASDWKANIICLGSHGRGPVQRFFLGSVSQKVLTEAPCSVRIGRHTVAAPGPLRIMVAADGSEESLAALAVVKHRHWPAGTHCAIVTVVDPRMESSVAWPGVYASDWVQQRDAEAREWVARMTEQYFRELESVGLRTETHVFDGDPKQVLAKQADEFGVSCVLLGARGLQHGLSRTLGSVATALAARAHCSVEVVRTPG